MLIGIEGMSKQPLLFTGNRESPEKVLKNKHYFLNFRTRLSESIYLFFNKKRRYFAMQVATLPCKLAVDP
jgi:hypothetical protein